MFQRILVPLDGSTRAESALPVAARLAKASGGSLILIQVAEPPVSSGKFSVPEAYPSRGTDEELAEATEGALAQYHLAVHTTVVINPDVAQAIVEAAERAEGAEQSGTQLIVMATHGRGGLQHWVLGSVAERVLHATTLPLLIVHAARGAHGTHQGEEAVV